jgi:histidyl-tRNA synthetase
VETLDGPKTPAVGFAVGIERISMMLPESLTPPSVGDKTVYIAAFGERAAFQGLKILQDLRLAGIRAVTDFRSATLKAHLRQADRFTCRYTLILGDDELDKGSAILRNMDTKDQQDLPLPTIVATLSARVLAP